MPATTVANSVVRMASALVLTMMVGGAAASAQPPGRPGGLGRDGFRAGGPPGGVLGPLGGLLALHPDLPLAALELTDTQREQVRTIMQGHRDEGRALMQKAQAALDALHKATRSTVDEGAAAQHGQALGAAIAEAAVLRAKVRGEVLAVLTPEQQAQADKISAARRGRRQRLRERRLPAESSSRPPDQRFNW